MYEQKLHEMLFDILESLHDAIIVDKDERIIFFGKDYCKSLGVDQADIIGKNVRDVIKNTRMHIVLQTNKEECGQVFFSVTESENMLKQSPTQVCNRLPIRRGGDPHGEVLGVFACGIITDLDDIEEMHQQLSSLQKNNDMMSSHLNEVYKVKYSLNSIKGSSAPMVAMRDIITRVSHSSLTVTISGETGTGKELIASAIHYMSPRHDKPFVKINCAAIPRELIESELFGYESGAFTGASKDGKIGKFELANHGTILLDEIGDMPLSAQIKLLRVLQERECERIGGNTTIPLDIRVLCSTNRDLNQMVRDGTFRADLFYRINVMEVRLPALREHIEDIPELCESFIEKYNKKNRVHITGVDPSVYPLLYSYSWPGNVRELEHVIECACVMAFEGILCPEHFGFLSRRIVNEPSKAPAVRTDTVFAPSPAMGLKERTIRDEKNEILSTLSKTRWNISATAKILQINRSSLYRKIKRYGIDSF